MAKTIENPQKTDTRKVMVELTPEEQEKAIAEAPKGTWAILLVYAGLMVLGWLAMFYGYFLPHGPVN